LLSIQNESAIIELSNESIKFRIISLKPYYQNDDHADNSDELPPPPAEPSIGPLIEPPIESPVESIAESQDNPDHTNLIIDLIVSTGPIKRGRGRLRKYSAPAANFIFNIISVDSPFIASRQKEIAGLLEKGVFTSINKRNVSTDVRIFSSRFVNEIKHSETEKAFEKF
jgi:hypothetical protein